MIKRASINIHSINVKEAQNVQDAVGGDPADEIPLADEFHY